MALIKVIKKGKYYTKAIALKTIYSAPNRIKYLEGSEINIPNHEVDQYL
jgi:hypothetical protein